MLLPSFPRFLSLSLCHIWPHCIKMQRKITLKHNHKWHERHLSPLLPQILYDMHTSQNILNTLYYTYQAKSIEVLMICPWLLVQVHDNWMFLMMTVRSRWNWLLLPLVQKYRCLLDVLSSCPKVVAWYDNGGTCFCPSGSITESVWMLQG